MKIQDLHRFFQPLMQVDPYILRNRHHMTRVFLSHAHMYVSSEGKIQEIQAANPTEKEGQIDRTNIGKQTPSLNTPTAPQPRFLCPVTRSSEEDERLLQASTPRAQPVLVESSLRYSPWFHPLFFHFNKLIDISISY